MLNEYYFDYDDLRGRGSPCRSEGSTSPPERNNGVYGGLYNTRSESLTLIAGSCQIPPAINMPLADVCNDTPNSITIEKLVYIKSVISYATRFRLQQI